jgi:phenylacetate-CoA ligase
MSPYTRLCSRVLFPLHERLKRHDSVRRQRELEKSQWWPTQRLRIDQFERLKTFLSLAKEQVPYYRDLFEALRFDPSRLRNIGDLAALPLLDKPTIRANVERLKAHGAIGLKRYNTGGSSGEPLVFYIGRSRRSHDVAAKWRATRWWGVDIGDPEVVVWGSPIELGAQDRLRTLRDRMIRSVLLPAFDMSASNLDRYVAFIRARRPSMLFGYPSSLALIASHARKQGTALDKLGIKVAFVTSERLYDDQRDLICSVFNCPVANGYGGRDAGFIAHECPSGRLHLSCEDIVVEIIDDTGRPAPLGESGEIIVTHLATGDFPFVRYATGDRGALDSEPCPCGRGLPTLKEIQGRSTDFVVASDGTVMHGLALIYAIRDLPGIERFKIIQHDLANTEVLIVPGDGYGPELETKIRDDFRKRLGANVAIGVTVVETIPPEASGKYRYIVSHATAPALANAAAVRPAAPRESIHA